MFIRSVKAIYTNELGWFDGEPEDLYPMLLDDESEKIVALIGGPTKIITAIAEAQALNDHRWALQLIKILRHAAKHDKSSK